MLVRKKLFTIAVFKRFISDRGTKWPRSNPLPE